MGRLLRARPLLRDDNKRQAVVALSSAELVYRDFELDLDGQLNEYQDRKAMGGTVLALSIRGGPRTASAISCMYIVWFKARANYSQWVAGTRQHTRDISLQALTSPLPQYVFWICWMPEIVCQHWSSDWRSQNGVGSSELSTDRHGRGAYFSGRHRDSYYFDRIQDSLVHCQFASSACKRNHGQQSSRCPLGHAQLHTPKPHALHSAHL